MKVARKSILFPVMLLVLFSCQSEKKNKERLYNESLERVYKTGDLSDYQLKHDSLVAIENIRNNAFLSIDSIMLKIEEIKARYEYEHGSLPKKVEIDLFSIEEKTNDILFLVRNSKNAEKDWDVFQVQLDNEIEKINKRLNKY